MYGLSKEERALFDTLRTPAQIQDFLNTLTARIDSAEPIVRSPRRAIETLSASCIEGALLAYAVLCYHKIPAYILDLRVGEHTGDVDHVVTLFKKDRYWGAISKTSHAVLRYREPIYKSIRELAISYFHEYFDDTGKKNLRSFSEPFDVFKHFGDSWITNTEDLFMIAVALDESSHQELLTPKQIRALRRADTIEIRAGKLKG